MEQFPMLLYVINWFFKVIDPKSGSGGSFVQQRGTICTNLVEGIMRNNSVKLFWIRCFFQKKLSRAQAALVFSGAEPSLQF